MFRIRIPVMLLLGAWMVWMVTGPAAVLADGGGGHVDLVDNCDPTDPAWGVGGCLIDEGTVTRAEFNAFSVFNPMFPLVPPPATPLTKAVIGHPSWRIDPGYLTIELGQKLKVNNAGGRGHTFTEVTNFGGGFVPVLNFGLTQAPECTPATAPVLIPGATTEVQGLGVGNHQFQCCIHSWMRALVKVKAEE